MGFDERGLLDKRINFGISKAPFDMISFRAESAHFFAHGRTEIRRQPFFEMYGFAYIKEGMAPAEYIDPGCDRSVVYILLFDHLYGISTISHSLTKEKEGDMNASAFLRIASLFLLVVVVHACASARTGEGEFMDARADSNSVFTEVWGLIQKHFAHPMPNTEEARAHCRLHLFYGDLAGCLSDPFAEYLDAKLLESFRLSTRGMHAGIGIEFFLSSGLAIVSSIVPNAPAAHSGAFRVGDVIVKIDNHDVAGLRTNAIDALVTGEVGSSVDMVLMREGVRMEPVILVRKIVEFPSVIAKKIEEGVLFVQLKSFYMPTSYDYMEAITLYCAQDKNSTSEIIERCIADKTRTPVIIADGRDNVGGIFRAAGRLCGFYAQQHDDIVVTLKSRYEEIVHRADNFLDLRAIGVLRDMPLIVMLNEESSSAMEIFAECTRQLGAVIVGVRSYGKGSTQDTYKLKNGDAIRFTTSRFLGGESRTEIDGIGIKPDYEMHEPDNCIPCKLHRGDAAHDPQFAVALDLARKIRQNLLQGVTEE